MKITLGSFVTLSGGFHNSPKIRVRIKKGFTMDALHTGELYDALSDGQVKKLERHFCGIKGCECGSWVKAQIEFNLEEI